jgi:phosphate:Na+ symporter
MIDPTTINPGLYPTSPTAVLLWLLAGVCLLLYSVRLVSDALRRVASGWMQRALTRLSSNPLAAFGIGVVGTAFIQSSAAMSSLLVEMVSVGLLPLSMAIVMVLGANVGSTLIVQLLALHITDHAVELLGLGVAVALFTHRSHTSFLRRGRVLFACGLMFLGLAVIGVAGQSLAKSDATGAVLKDLVNAPIVLIVIGTLMAMLLNSSIATIGLVLTLAAQGTLQPAEQPQIGALALMLGANVGTTLLSMLTALNQKTLVGRRLALVHSGTKLLGATFLLILINPLADVMNYIWPDDPGTQVALAHMGFNLALAVIFVPLSGQLARLMERLQPEKNPPKPEKSYMCILDPRALASPAVAQGLATGETLRMADVVTEMFNLSIQAFEERPIATRKRILAMEKQLDELNAEIKGYLMLLDEGEMTEEQMRKDIALFTAIGDLEAIGDLITHRFISLAHRLSRSQIQFSEEGWEGLRNYHHQIEDALQHVLVALATQNSMLITKFADQKKNLALLKRKLYVSHIRELRDDVANSRESSAVYMDLLDALSAVLAYISNIATTLQETSSPQFYTPFQCPLTGQDVQLEFPRNGQLYISPLAKPEKERSSLLPTTNSLPSPLTGQDVQLEFPRNGQLYCEPPQIFPKPPKPL